MSEKEYEFKIDDDNNNNNMHEYIIHQLEINQSSKWKTYQNGWFDQNMKPLKTIETPYDIKLPPNTNKGTWKWSENWWCIDTDSSNNNNIDNTLYNNNIVRLQSLKYMSTPTPTGTNNQQMYQNRMDNIPDNNIAANGIDNNNQTQTAQNGDAVTEAVTGGMEVKESMDESQQESVSKMEMKTEIILPVKKKKKRIRIKKNAKKLFRKMKGKDKKGLKDGNKDIVATSRHLKASKSEGDILKLSGKDKNKLASRSSNNFVDTLMLSTNEQNELHELFTSIDRGWAYAIKFSKHDNDWNHENKIIAKCNYRRRTWVRCAILDISPHYNHNKNDEDEV